MKNIKSKENLPLKMSLLCVLCDKKEILVLKKFCAYIGLLRTIEILVFNYNKIYGERIGLIISLHNIHGIDYNY